MTLISFFRCNIAPGGVYNALEEINRHISPTVNSEKSAYTLQTFNISLCDRNVQFFFMARREKDFQ